MYCGTQNKNTQFQAKGPIDPGHILNQVFQDTDGNGVPDILEQGNMQTVENVTSSTVISVNGKTYNNLDDVPDEFKEQLQRLKNIGNGEATPLTVSTSFTQTSMNADVKGVTDEAPVPLHDEKTMEYLNSRRAGTKKTIAPFVFLGIAILLTATVFATSGSSTDKVGIVTWKAISLGILLVSVFIIWLDRKNASIRKRQAHVALNGIKTAATIAHIHHKSSSSGTSGEIDTLAITFDVSPQTGPKQTIKKIVRVHPLEHHGLKLNEECILIADPNDPTFFVWPKELRSHSEFIQLRYENRYR